MIFNFPHAGYQFPESERTGLLLNEQELLTEILRVTDWYTDIIFGSAAHEDDIIVQFPVSRLVLDPERFVEDTREPMAARGAGVIYTKSSAGRCLRFPVPEQTRQRLLNTYYYPHHRKLDTAVFEELDRYGHSLILDCHSFPSEPLHYDLDQSLARPDICIGTDTFHTPPDLVDAAVKAFSDMGYSVSIDTPYSGCLVPENCYQRNNRVASIMIEINRKLYMDESNGEKSEGFEKICLDTIAVIALIRQTKWEFVDSKCEPIATANSTASLNQLDLVKPPTT